MADFSIQEMMTRMPTNFLPEKAAGVSAVIQYHLTGAEASDWVITIKDGTCAVVPGTAAAPTMTFTADSQIYKDIASGKINGMTAFMQGKVKLAGDLNVAMKLIGFFKS